MGRGKAHPGGGAARSWYSQCASAPSVPDMPDASFRCCSSFMAAPLPFPEGCASSPFLSKSRRDACLVWMSCAARSLSGSTRRVAAVISCFPSFSLLYPSSIPSPRSLPKETRAEPARALPLDMLSCAGLPTSQPVSPPDRSLVPLDSLRIIVYTQYSISSSCTTR